MPTHSSSGGRTPSSSASSAMGPPRKASSPKRSTSRRSSICRSSSSAKTTATRFTRTRADARAGRTSAPRSRLWDAGRTDRWQRLFGLTSGREGRRGPRARRRWAVVPRSDDLPLARARRSRPRLSISDTARKRKPSRGWPPTRCERLAKNSTRKSVPASRRRSRRSCCCLRVRRGQPVSRTPRNS